MALDHYVSQVHLRKFCSSALKNRLHAMRKSDLARFTPRTKDVCAIDDGSTNAYLKEDRAIEQFLKTVEPKYNTALVKLRENKIDQESVYVIAGFTAFVVSCAPAAMRVHTEPFRSVVESTTNILDRLGKLGKAPAALGGKSISKLLADGTVHIEVDGKYPQAIGISSIIQRVSIFGNSAWEILINNEPDAPFFTSDFPAAIELRRDNIINHLVPLAPDVCVRILPDIRLSRAKPDLTFQKFKYRHRKPPRVELVEINRRIVQCAEDLVFFRDDLPWIEQFVSKNRTFHIEAVTQRIPHGTGFMTIAQRRIKRRAV